MRPAPGSSSSASEPVCSASGCRPRRPVRPGPQLSALPRTSQPPLSIVASARGGGSARQPVLRVDAGAGEVARNSSPKASRDSRAASDTGWLSRLTDRDVERAAAGWGDHRRSATSGVAPSAVACADP
jgi:hypothetical protein